MKHKLFPIMNVKKTTIIIITILLLLLVGCQGTTQPAPSPQPQLADPTAVPVEVVQETDAAVLLETYHAEFNAGNIDGVTALVSDDFTMSIVYGSADDPVFQGKEALAELLGSTQEDNFHLTVNDLQVAGDQITFTFSGLGNGLRQLGVGPEVGTAEATIQDDLIESITYTVDPEWVAAADAAEAALQQEAMIALIELSITHISPREAGWDKLQVHQIEFGRKANIV
jgi:hypothetical protein